MEILIASDRPLCEIEDQTIDALQRTGFVVQRTFRLDMPGSDGDSCPDPVYSVLMLYRSGPPQRSVGRLTLYGRGGQAVLESLLAPPEMGEAGSSGGRGDAEAEVAAALSLGGFDFCVHAAGGSDCIDASSLVETD